MGRTFVERAKTSKSSCRVCEEKIEKGAYRVGVEVYSPFGQSLQFMHPDCCLFCEESPSARFKCNIDDGSCCDRRITKNETIVRVRSGIDENGKSRVDIKLHVLCAATVFADVSDSVDALQELSTIQPNKKIPKPEAPSSDDDASDEYAEYSQPKKEVRSATRKCKKTVDYSGADGDEQLSEGSQQKQETEEREKTSSVVQAVSPAVVLSDYERQRIDNIHRNNEMLTALGLLASKVPKQLAPKKRAKPARQDVLARTSKRLRGLGPSGDKLKLEERATSRVPQRSRRAVAERTSGTSSAKSATTKKGSSSGVQRSSGKVAWLWAGKTCYGTLMTKADKTYKYARTGRGNVKTLRIGAAYWWSV